ncbi:MAG: hypothetical protein WBA84_10605 [Carnobacterium sp.]
MLEKIEDNSDLGLYHQAMNKHQSLLIMGWIKKI